MGATLTSFDEIVLGMRSVQVNWRLDASNANPNAFESEMSGDALIQSFQ